MSAPTGDSLTDHILEDVSLAPEQRRAAALVVASHLGRDCGDVLAALGLEAA